MSVMYAKKEQLVERLLQAKHKSGKTYDQIADECGLTNAYTAQLFYNQAHLKEETAPKLQKAVPELTDDLIEEMKKPPFRCYDPSITQEPHIYRTQEAILHYGRAIKDIVNEKFGDGIMSAIDFVMEVKKVKGAKGEDRVLITMNGKFLPHCEQLQSINVVNEVKEAKEAPSSLHVLQ